MTNKYTDLYVEADADGIYDLVIDDDGDFKKTAGMDSAIFISIFSDRRANPDEVADPMKRRGWCGTENTEDQQGNVGSGLWLREQSRLSKNDAEFRKMEAYQCLHWLIADSLAKKTEVTITQIPEDRSEKLNINITAANGGVTNTGFQLWDGTPRRTIKK